MKASVVIPTRNKASYLELTLESLVHQSFDPSQYEVIVVNDGSTDSTREVVERFRGRNWKFRYIEQAQAGRSVARNAGIRAASGKVVIFVDDDCLCNRTLIAAHIASHSKTGQKAVIGWTPDVLSRIPLHQESLIHNLRSMAGRLEGIPASLDFEKIMAALPDTLDLITANDIARKPEKFNQLLIDEDNVYLKNVAEGCCPCPWIFFVTRNASVDRYALLQIGLFDEDLQGWGEEDTELAYRLFRAGVTFDATFDAVIYHQLHPRNKLIGQKEWRLNYVKSANKHKKPEWYLRWQMVEGIISRNQYEDMVRKIERGLLSKIELQAIKERYDQFVAANLNDEYKAG